MDRNRRERTSPATSNRMFHPAGATSFPCARAVLLLADKIPFVLICSSFLQSFAQHIFGPRCRYSIRTTSRCSRVRHEAAPSGVKAPDMFRPRAERALRLRMVPHSPKRRAIFELSQVRLPDEPIRPSATHKPLRGTYQKNPTIPD